MLKFCVKKLAKTKRFIRCFSYLQWWRHLYVAEAEYFMAANIYGWIFSICSTVVNCMWKAVAMYMHTHTLKCCFLALLQFCTSSGTPFPSDWCFSVQASEAWEANSVSDLDCSPKWCAYQSVQNSVQKKWSFILGQSSYRHRITSFNLSCFDFTGTWHQLHC